VIRDINPHAPVHLLIIPVRHFDGIADAAAHDVALLGRMVQTAHPIALEQQLNNGYRIIMNEGEDGGKLVSHLHMHLLGGTKLGPKLVSQ